MSSIIRDFLELVAERSARDVQRMGWLRPRSCLRQPPRYYIHHMPIYPNIYCILV
jgi:hypothetical protein